MPEVPELADWWDKVNAGVTLAAVIVAMFVAIGESRRRRTDQADAAAGQARTVTVQRFPHGVLITNHSASPVLSLKVLKLEIIEGGMPKWESTGNEATIEVVAPGAFIKFPFQGFRRPGTTEVLVQRHLSPDDDLRCTFTFTDAEGLRWKRVHLEQPERVLDSPTGWRRLLFWR